uniref:Variant surface glycoprotein 746 n=1 Tax=Trypanosoma brucei TaxID=5691 RepID=M4SUA4_9TRYP|nr:variant surface glycoprotein 746 [Trypanosoma brucei]
MMWYLCRVNCSDGKGRESNSFFGLTHKHWFVFVRFLNSLKFTFVVIALPYVGFVFAFCARAWNRSASLYTYFSEKKTSDIIVNKKTYTKMLGMRSYIVFVAVVTLQHICVNSKAHENNIVNGKEFEALCGFINFALDTQTPQDLVLKVEEAEDKILSDTFAAGGDAKVSKELQELKQKVETYKEQHSDLWSSSTPTIIQKSLTEALYGNGNKQVVVKHVQGNRSDVCGRAGGQTGKKAGETLALDLLCICAASDQDEDDVVTCCNGCNTTHVGVWEPQQNSPAHWNLLHPKCSNVKREKTRPLQVLSAALRFFVSTLNTTSNSSSGPRNLLGAHDGSVEHGCSGGILDGHGRCVIYLPRHVSESAPTIPWYLKLQEAATKMEELIQAEEYLVKIQNQVNELKREARPVPNNSSEKEKDESNNTDNGLEGKKPTTSSKRGCSGFESKVTCLQQKPRCEWNGTECVTSIRRLLTSSGVNRLPAPLKLFFLVF